jgi:hypothetical protein
VSDLDHGNYHEGTEAQGIVTLIALILGLLLTGVLLFALTWAMASYSN